MFKYSVVLFSIIVTAGQCSEKARKCEPLRSFQKVLAFQQIIQRKYSSESINAAAIYDRGKTLLHFAVLEGEEDIVERLIKVEGADVNAQDKDGVAPLHCTAMTHSPEGYYVYVPSSRTKILELLVRAGAMVNAEDLFGCTPLHYFARISSVDMSAHFISIAKCIEALIKAGANINLQDKCGNTPLDIASHHVSRSIVGLFVQETAKSNSFNKFHFPLHRAISRNQLLVAQLLIEAGVDVNARDANGYTPLQLAINKGEDNIFGRRGYEQKGIEIVQILLKYAADPNVQDENGYTPLHWAANYGNIQLVEELLKHTEIIELLQEDKVETNVPHKNEFTPLHYAAEEGDLESIKELSKYL